MGFTKRVKEKYNLLIDRKEFQKAIRYIGYDIKRQDIVAMAFSRQAALRKLRDLNMQICEHLLKVLVMPTSTDAKHWKQELKSWQGMLKQHNKGKLPSKTNYSDKILLDWLWNFPFGLPSDRTDALDRLRKSGYAVPKTVDEKKLNQAVMKFIGGVPVKK